MTEPIPIFERLRARWVLLLVALVLGAAAGVAFDRLRPDTYTASAEAVVAPDAQDPVVDSSIGITQAYARLAIDPNVVSDTLEDEDIAIPPGDLDEHIRASASPDAPVIQILGTRESPAEAALLTNAVLDALIAYSQRANGLDYTLEPFAEASAPTVSSDPGPVLYGLLGGGLGLLLGGLLALVLPPKPFVAGAERRLRTADQVQREFELPVLARVPRRRRSDASVSAFNEGYGLLRTNLQFAGEKSRPEAIAVTSANAGEGKTTTAANLAIAWASAGHRVIAVEADFRRPALQQELMPETDAPLLPGLSNYLLELASAEQIVYPTGKPNVGFVPVGPRPPNPSALLDSRRGRTVVDDFKELADLIVVDCPPLNPGADASVVSGWVDGVLLVVDLTTSTERAVRDAVRQLEAVEAQVLGVLLNRDPSIDTDDSYYHGDAQFIGADGRKRRLGRRKRQVSDVSNGAARTPSAAGGGR